MNLDALRHSGFIWVRRRWFRQPVRAYLKTVCQVFADSAGVRGEAAKPQSYLEAKKFARVTSLLFSLALLINFVRLIIWGGGMGAIGLGDRQTTAAYPFSVSVAYQSLLDFTLPWSAGATLWGVLPIGIVLSCIYVVKTPARCLRVWGNQAVDAESAAAVGAYSTGGLSLVLFFTIAAVILDMTYWPYYADAKIPPIAFVLRLITDGGQDLIAVIVWFRLAQWIARVGGKGFWRMLRRWLVLSFILTLGPIVWCGIMPWAVGYLWLLVDRLRA